MTARCLSRASLAILVALAGGCACRVPPPAIRVSTVTVRVPVPVPCIKAVSELPEEPPLVASQLTGRAKHDLLIVDQSALSLRTWGESLRGMLIGCSEQSK